MSGPIARNEALGADATMAFVDEKRLHQART
jgi:hypothetical protein